MCEEFNLEFTDETGIVAWASPAFFKMFSGPGMVEGDEWRIHLGREIPPDESRQTAWSKGENPGFWFVASVLEDAMYNPLFPHSVSAPKFQWETVKDKDGVWVTRPKVAYNDDEEGEDDDEEMDEFEMEDAGNEESDDSGHPALKYGYNSPGESSGYESSEDSNLDEIDIDPRPDVVSNARLPDYTYGEDEDEEIDELDSSEEDQLDSEDDNIASGDEEIRCGYGGDSGNCSCRRCRVTSLGARHITSVHPNETLRSGENRVEDSPMSV